MWINLQIYKMRRGKQEENIYKNKTEMSSNQIQIKSSE